MRGAGGVGTVIPYILIAGICCKRCSHRITNPYRQFCTVITGSVKRRDGIGYRLYQSVGRYSSYRTCCPVKLKTPYQGRRDGIIEDVTSQTLRGDGSNGLIVQQHLWRDIINLWTDHHISNSCTVAAYAIDEMNGV